MMTRHVRVAVCGHLPTACDFLLRQGVVQIDQYEDAAELTDETAYHLILIYAPNAEGILNTVYSQTHASGKEKATVPIRLLNEPACNSALLELRSMIRRISGGMSRDMSVAAQ
jgi:hypothetical protein